MPHYSFSILNAVLFSGSSEGSRYSVLRSQLSITELIAVSRSDQHKLLGAEETGLQEHNEENCLYCAGLYVLGCNLNTPTQNRTGKLHVHPNEYRKKVISL